MKYTNTCMPNKKLVRKLCFIAALVLFLGSCASKFQNTTGRDYQGYQIKKIEDLLYIQGRVSLKNSEGTLLGSAELFVKNNIFFLHFKDSFFRSVLQFSMDSKNIQLVQRTKTIKLKNNYQNKIGLWGLDLNNAEIQSIFWGRKTQATKNLEFVFKDGKPISVTKKNAKTKLQVSYLAWGENTTIHLPSKIQIVSDNPVVEIKIVIQKQSIHPQNFPLPNIPN